MIQHISVSILIRAKMHTPNRFRTLQPNPSWLWAVWIGVGLFVPEVAESWAVHHGAGGNGMLIVGRGGIVDIGGIVGVGEVNFEQSRRHSPLTLAANIKYYIIHNIYSNEYILSCRTSIRMLCFVQATMTNPLGPQQVVWNPISHISLNASG